MTYDWRLSIDALRGQSGASALFGLEPALSYAELAAGAAQVAADLAAVGFERGDAAALLFGRRGHGEAVALAALLTAGYVAVPLDSANPPGRLNRIIEGRGCRALLHDRAARDSVGRLDVPIRRVELADDGAITDRAGDPPRAGALLPDVATILHTSGTTGAPKAVPISWEGLDAFTAWMIGLTGIGPGKRVLRVAELVFDLAWFDHLASWRAGATLCTLSRRDLATARTLAARVRDLRPHVIYGVPSLFMKLTTGLSDGEALPAELGTVCFAGEVFPPRELQALHARLGEARMFNLFGPTETNVCTFHEVDRAQLDGQREIPIGLPTPYARCWLAREGEPSEPLDGAGVGELVVAGPTALGGRVATGDRVERGSDGLFYFRGRLDRMVKIRGYRIQPAEVEAGLRSHRQVREAAVTAVERPRLGTVLHGFVTLRRSGDPVDARALRSFAATLLPAYMVPDGIHVVDSLPRTSTGKIDYAALAERAQQ